MKLNFRIDWGYQYLYSRRHYHPFCHWDGHIECSSGRIEQVFQLDYPVIWYGPGHCARETLLEGNAWKSTTRRGLAGIRVEAEIPEDAVFTLVTLSGTFRFMASEIISQGRIEFPVGPKYLGNHIIVTKNGYYWYRPQAKAGQTLIEADELGASVPVRDWARMRVAWIDPGKCVKFTAVIPEKKADFYETVLHLVMMAAPAYTPGTEKQAYDFFPMRLLIDGRECCRFTRYLRRHDEFMQLLEDEWIRFQVSPGKHEFQLCNDHLTYSLLINRVILQPSPYRHLELSLPQWALAGEKLIGRVFAAREDHTTVCWGDGSCELDLKKGWNEFPFSVARAGLNHVVRTELTRAEIPVVYDVADEKTEVMVGYDMTTVPHDGNGFMDWLLDYTWRTRLGNIVVFRNFIRLPGEKEHLPVPDELLSRWGKFCREHRIYVEAATDFDSGALVQAAGDMLHSVGRHEWPGAVYAFDPQPEWESDDMKTAMEHYLKRLKIEIDRAHKVSRRAAFGDASGGHRYCYMAGVDFIRTETMVPHTQHLCSQARPASEVFQKGEWGVHIAIQHPFQPYYETHLGQYFLSLFQPWMMGAKMIYEEDSLFCLFKEERQAWDDLLTKGKRDMTRDFFRFVKTHPRTGAPVRKIAFVEGRYAAPFNGFICDVEQTPDYSVWGLFGNNAPEWGHRQPEKCRQLLDVLMPGASTLPLRQDFTKRRFFFSGTPYGDFDEIPTEASEDYFSHYSLLLHLGWNTMIQEDYEKLCGYVKNGGTLLIGLPQFSRHVKREFLLTMDDLQLWNDGDLCELCGVKIRGKGELFSGTWNCADRMDYPEVTLSAIPSRSSEEDGECRLADIELAGGEGVIWDSFTEKTLVVRHSFGKGVVYLLTAYAYPGHEKLQPFMASLIAKLASRHLPECRVEDPSREVFWNMWNESEYVRRLMLLNTDWTVKGNRKRVKIHTPVTDFETDVVEREPKILTVLTQAVLETEPSLYVEAIGPDQVRIHGTGRSRVEIHRVDGTCQDVMLEFSENPFRNLQL